MGSCWRLDSKSLLHVGSGPGPCYKTFLLCPYCLDPGSLFLDKTTTALPSFLPPNTHHTRTHWHVHGRLRLLLIPVQSHKDIILLQDRISFAARANLKKFAKALIVSHNSVMAALACWCRMFPAERRKYRKLLQDMTQRIHSIDYILLAAGFENTQWGNKEALSGTNKQACLYKLTKPLKVHTTFSQMSINYLLSLPLPNPHSVLAPFFRPAAHDIIQGVAARQNGDVWGRSAWLLVRVWGPVVTFVYVCQL